MPVDALELYYNLLVFESLFVYNYRHYLSNRIRKITILLRKLCEKNNRVIIRAPNAVTKPRQICFDLTSSHRSIIIRKPNHAVLRVYEKYNIGFRLVVKITTHFFSAADVLVFIRHPIFKYGKKRKNAVKSAAR